MQPYASSLIKIFLKNQTAALIDYHSYEILATSDDISDVIENKQEKIKHSSVIIAKKLRQATLMFRAEGLTSSWIFTLKPNKLLPISLYQIDDIPIFYNGNLIGILCKFQELTLDNLYLIDRYLSTNRTAKRACHYQLSNSEKEILFLAGLGKSAKQIANQLNEIGVKSINYGTVKSVISQRIYKKINVNNTSDALMCAIKDKQINNIPEGLLKLNSYYLIDTKQDCINL